MSSYTWSFQSCGASVNDGIPKDVFSVQYMSMDDIIDGIMTYGCGTLMAKFDIESAHHIVPVHLDDRFLLGMQWRGNFFIDLALPFGLRSAPYIFSAVADLLEWIVRRITMWLFLSTTWMTFTPWGPVLMNRNQWKRI